jgi:plastocyanin
MKKILLTTALVLLASPAFAKEYTIKEVSDPAGAKPYYFSPDKLTIQPGDTVTFVNAQEDMHDVMFVEVPKGVDEMIMSPMHEKEGDKFSYTFTVPGTYKFHCHPHEALGMNGTLIVGQVSKPGETVKMDHHKMGEIHDDAMKDGAQASDHHDQKAIAANAIEATGKINSVDPAKGTVNVTHDPIKALGWPKMKMEFSVEKGVELSSFKAGDAVKFSLKPEGEDNYVVVKLNKE